VADDQRAPKPEVTVPQFYYGLPDINDCTPWSDQDIADLRDYVESGFTLEETAGSLCRAGTAGEVATKAQELGLEWRVGRNRHPSPNDLCSNNVLLAQ
jgi:hypothetical protein